MTTPKRNHVVPKAYLEGFTEADSGFLYVYSKRNGMWRRQRPTQVMVRGNYYRQDWAPEGVDKNILEKFFGSEVEPKGLAALGKLVETPEVLDANDTAEIISYLQFQRLRVPRQADMAKLLLHRILTSDLSKTPEGRDALKHAPVVIKDSFRIEFMRMMHGELSPYFSRMVWDVVEAESGSTFITSDSPVTFFNVDYPPPAEPGAAHYGTIVMFPLNKRFLLHMSHPEYLRKEKGASDRLPDNLDIEDGTIEIRKGTVWTKERVETANWIMFQLSQDVVVGESKEVLELAVGNALTEH